VEINSAKKTIEELTHKQRLQLDFTSRTCCFCSPLCVCVCVCLSLSLSLSSRVSVVVSLFWSVFCCCRGCSPGVVRCSTLICRREFSSLSGCRREFSSLELFVVTAPSVLETKRPTYLQQRPTFSDPPFPKPSTPVQQKGFSCI
jgi:hypothetical protein